MSAYFRRYAVIITLLSLCFSIFAQEDAIPFDEAYKRIYHITKITGERPIIDGKLDEAVWQEQGEWTEYFVQVTPHERMPSNSPTKAKLFYDKNIFMLELSPTMLFPIS